MTVDPKDVLERYLDGWNTGDMEAVIGLFADDAVVEDPYGTPALEGKAAVREFFTAAGKSGAKLTLDSPIRGSHGDAAAMAFTVSLSLDGTPMTIKVIDVMRFNESGQIRHMQAFWGPADLTTG